jgi:hypothetical protein
MLNVASNIAKRQRFDPCPSPGSFIFYMASRLFWFLVGSEKTGEDQAVTRSQDFAPPPLSPAGIISVLTRSPGGQQVQGETILISS